MGAQNPGLKIRERKRRRFRVLLALLLATGVTTACVCRPPATRGTGDYVVLLHGMRRSPLAMRVMERRLTDVNYAVINEGYRSGDESIDAMVDSIAETVREQCTDTARPVHYVTHSLGGILLRAMHRKYPELPIDRVVMLGPPNQGSELADTMRRIPLYETFTGPAGPLLGTGKDDLPHQLGPVDFELGVIAGDRTLNPLYSAFIDGPNDGKVSVSNTVVEGMSDQAVVHGSHTFLMNRRAAFDQTLYFLQHGRFRQDGDS